MAKNTFKAEVVSIDEAQSQLSELRSKGGGRRTSKFDPLKQHIQWLNREEVLRIDEMSKNDVPNLRSFIERNIKPVEKDLAFVVRSSKIDDDGSRYRVYVSKEKIG